MLNHLSLFSGIGGIDLAAHWAGFQTVAFCEQNKFCQKVLNKHWPEVPIFDDIFTLTAESLERRGIKPGEIKLISGGVPCQPYSFAGKRMGDEDDRALWPEMFRVIKEIRPVYILIENVLGFVSLALDGVLSDLESENYTCQPVVLPACAVNAPHRRNRVFIIAHTTEQGLQNWRGTPLDDYGTESQPERRNSSPNWLQAMAYPERKGLEIWHGKAGERPHPAITGSGWWAIEPNVGRVASRVPRRVDRLRALGNAVVPQQVYPILKAIADYESEQAA